MTDLKPYYQVKHTLYRCMSYFLNNPQKTENEKYAYDIVQKAYNFLTQKEGVSNNDY